MSFAKFMASPMGRWLRVVAGLALIALGLFAVGGVGGGVLAAVGVVPLLAGMFNLCLFAPLFGAPFLGRDALTKP
jgi:hypothetical protein